MSRLFQIFLFIQLIGCAHSIEDPVPEPIKSPKVISAPHSKVECNQTSQEDIEQCTLFIFECTDSQTEYMLICPTEFAIGDKELIPEPYVYQNKYH